MSTIQKKIYLNEIITAIAMREKLLEIIALTENLDANIDKIHEITPFVDGFSKTFKRYGKPVDIPANVLWEAEKIARGGSTPFHKPWPDKDEILEFASQTAPALLNAADLCIEAAVKNGIIDDGECALSIDKVHARLKPFKTQIRNGKNWRWNKNPEWQNIRSPEQPTIF